jgi:hypothetical protein
MAKTVPLVKLNPALLAVDQSVAVPTWVGLLLSTVSFWPKPPKLF